MEEKKIENQIAEGQVYTDGYYVSVTFPNSRPYYFHTYNDTLNVGTNVVVETVRGVEMGVISGQPKPVSELKSEIPLKSVIRIATEMDERAHQENLESAKSAYKICEKCISELGLDMKLLQAEYTLDKQKVIFLYVADNRVDFRELLKELAAALHCRIELRQIGTRDRSRLIGGLGPCGLPLCCNTFLGEFDGISINMAKNQFLALNIQKLSGQCGKLLCCLKYEDDDYTKLKEGLPRIGYRLFYEGEQYKITSINVLTGDVRIENAENSRLLTVDEIRQIVNKAKREEHE